MGESGLGASSPSVDTAVTTDNESEASDQGAYGPALPGNREEGANGNNLASSTVSPWYRTYVRTNALSPTEQEVPRIEP